MSGRRVAATLYGFTFWTHYEPSMPWHFGQPEHRAEAGSIGGPALLLATPIQPQRWLLDVVPATSLGL